MAARRYYRVGPSFWLEPLDDDGRLAGLYVLTCRHRNVEGLFRMPLSYGAEDLGWTLKRFTRAFEQLRAQGLVEYDDQAKVCLIVKALKWQPIENPNQVKAAIKELDELPATALIDRLETLAQQYCQRLAEAMRERFSEPFPEPPREGSGKPPSPSPSHRPPQTPPPPSGGAEVIDLVVPTGKRGRELERFQRLVRDLAHRLFPATDEPERDLGLVESALRAGARTDDEIRSFVAYSNTHGTLPWRGQWRAS